MSSLAALLLSPLSFFHEYKTTWLNGRLITHLPRNLPPRTSQLPQVCRFHPISSLRMKKAVITVWNLPGRQLQSNGIGVWKHALLLTIGYIPIILIPLQGFRMEGTGGKWLTLGPLGTVLMWWVLLLSDDDAQSWVPMQSGLLLLSKTPSECLQHTHWFYRQSVTAG